MKLTQAILTIWISACSVQYRLRDITPFSFSIYILEVGGWLDSKLSLQYHIVQPFTWYNSSDLVARVRFIYFSRLSLAAYRVWMGVPSSRYFAGFAGKYVFLLSSVYPSLASLALKCHGFLQIVVRPICACLSIVWCISHQSIQENSRVERCVVYDIPAGSDI